MSDPTPPAAPDPTVEARIDELAGVLDTHEWSEAEDFCNCGHYVGARMPSVHKWHLATILAEHTERAVKEALEAAAVSGAKLEPWGSYEMGGFEGCTDVNPEHCACATDVQPTCRLCGEEIEPGQQAWSRQWPCYDTLPLDHRDQDWDVISWHDECPPAPTGGRP